MVKTFVVAACAVAWCAITFADDPAPTPPVPTPVPATITAPKEVSGTGKKQDPYIFTLSTRCLLRLNGEAAGVQWDTDDAPSDVEILDNRYASFSLYEPGLYQITVYGGPVYNKVWFQIKSGTDPPPGPGPGPVDPIPDPKPDPNAVGKLWVVIVKDGARVTQLPSSQMQALLSTTIREYCGSHCLPGTDGKTPEFKVYDRDTDVSKQSPAIQKAFKTAVEDMTKAGASGPWLTLSNGKTGYSGPLPLTEAAVLDKLKVYGGQ